MKKFLLTFSAILLFSFLAKAGDNDLFRYDRNKIDQALSNATQVENLVAEDPSLTWDDLNNAGNPVIASIEPVSNPFEEPGEPPLGVPSFIWGCLLGFIGVIVVVMATSKNTAETNRAIWGCILSSAVVALFLLIVNSLENNADAWANGCINGCYPKY